MDRPGGCQDLGLVARQVGLLEFVDRHRGNRSSIRGDRDRDRDRRLICVGDQSSADTLLGLVRLMTSCRDSEYYSWKNLT